MDLKTKKLSIIVLFMSILFAYCSKAEIAACTNDGKIIKNTKFILLKEELKIEGINLYGDLQCTVTYRLKSMSDDPMEVIYMGIFFVDDSYEPYKLKPLQPTPDLRKIHNDGKTIYLFGDIFKEKEEKEFQFSYFVPFLTKTECSLPDPLTKTDAPKPSVFSLYFLYANFSGRADIWIEHNFSDIKNWGNNKDDGITGISIALNRLLKTMRASYDVWDKNKHDYRNISLPAANPYIMWKSNWPLIPKNGELAFEGNFPTNDLAFKINFYRTVFPCEEKEADKFIEEQLVYIKHTVAVIIKVYEKQIEAKIETNLGKEDIIKREEYIIKDKEHLSELKKLESHFPDLKKDYVDIILEFYGQKTNNENIQSFLKRQFWFSEKNKPKASKEFIDYLLNNRGQSNGVIGEE
jgi:hypothetical protein